MRKSSSIKKTACILIACLILASALLLAGCGGSKGGENGEVRVYCLGDYIDPDLVGEFEEATGIKVVMDTFDTNEEMYPVISKNSVSYDVICCSDYMIERLISEGALAEIDYSNVPNLENLDPAYLSLAEGCDPGNKYAVPHTFGTLGIMYNTENIAPGEITSWNDLWKEEYSQQIVMPDSMRDNFAIALKALGYSINTTDESEIKDATEYMEAQKPLVYKYANDSARDMAIGGSADIAVVWNGEILYSQAENDALDFVIPEEGTEMFLDLWAIPAAGENKANGEAWINFMLDKDVAVTNYEYLTYSIPNVAVMEYVFEDPQKVAYLFPGEAVLGKCEQLKSLGAENDDMYGSYWKEFKGQ